MKDGYYIFKGSYSTECFEIKNGVLYTHYSTRRDYNPKPISKWKSDFPRRFGPVKIAKRWLDDNKDNIIKYTKDEIFLDLL